MAQCAVSDVRAREDQESSSANAVVAYSERISTMARHAATSFDTGFGMGLTLSREVYQRIARYHHNRLSVLAHQPSIYHRERMLAPHVQQPGACDFGSSQYRYILCMSGFVIYFASYVSASSVWISVLFS